MFWQNGGVFGAQIAAEAEPCGFLRNRRGFHGAEKVSRIGVNFEVNTESRFGKFGGIGVDHDPVSGAGEIPVVVSDDAQVHAGSENEKAVRVLKDEVRSSCAHHAGASEELRRVGGEQVDSGNRGEYGNVPAFRD